MGKKNGPQSIPSLTTSDATARMVEVVRARIGLLREPSWAPATGCVSFMISKDSFTQFTSPPTISDNFGHFGHFVKSSCSSIISSSGSWSTAVPPSNYAPTSTVRILIKNRSCIELHFFDESSVIDGEYVVMIRRKLAIRRSSQTGCPLGRILPPWG